MKACHRHVEGTVVADLSPYEEVGIKPTSFEGTPLVFLPAYGAVACPECKTGIWHSTSKIRGHLKQKHNISIKPAAVERFHSEHKVHAGNTPGIFREPNRFPKELPILQTYTGFNCLECFYSTSNVDEARRHQQALNHDIHPGRFQSIYGNRLDRPAGPSGPIVQLFAVTSQAPAVEPPQPPSQQARPWRPPTDAARTVPPPVQVDQAEDTEEEDEGEESSLTDNAGHVPPSEQVEHSDDSDLSIDWEEEAVPWRTESESEEEVEPPRPPRPATNAEWLMLARGRPINIIPKDFLTSKYVKEATEREIKARKEIAEKKEKREAKRARIEQNERD